ncbi:MAG: hypothetical protein IPJ74_08360 [Saprospiraceae bacterium]|nr:hypothetical protein [Saprospiraceae bacterium]
MSLLAKSKFPLLILSICLLFCANVHAQKSPKFKYSIPGLDSLQNFIVNGGASTVLGSGQTEVIWNNTLASYWIALHENGKNSPIFDRIRQTQFISDLYGFYGVSSSGRWDIGIQLRYLRARKDNAATSSMFKVFESENMGNNEKSPDAASEAIGVIFDETFGGLGSVGLRFRALPLKTVPELTVNGGYSISTIKSEKEQYQLGAGRDMADIGVTYYKSINQNTYYFFSGMFMAFLPSEVENSTPVEYRDEYLFNTNVSFFLIQRTSNNKFTFYPGLSYGLNFKPAEFGDQSLVRTQEFLFAYAGIQYAPNIKYNVFLTGGIPLIFEVESFQQEIVRESYSILSLGVRAGF